VQFLNGNSCCWCGFFVAVLSAWGASPNLVCSGDAYISMRSSMLQLAGLGCGAWACVATDECVQSGSQLFWESKPGFLLLGVAHTALNKLQEVQGLLVIGRWCNQLLCTVVTEVLVVQVPSPTYFFLG
jgi:hypothetical protein